MKYFDVHIKSVGYKFHFQAQIIAIDDEQAKKMAGEQFYDSVQGFFEGVGRPHSGAVAVVSKIALLRDATYTVSELKVPTVIKSAWDRYE